MTGEKPRKTVFTSQGKGPGNEVAVFTVSRDGIELFQDLLACFHCFQNDQKPIKPEKGRKPCKTVSF